MSNQICLKWNSFLNNIATSFESLWEEEDLVDVTLASDGQCLTAHKVILSASSPFFKKVFQANPCQHPVIILQDVHFSELEALLIFIYKGEVNIEQENLPALLKAAETLQIRGLAGGDTSAKESHKQFTTTETNRNDANEAIDVSNESLPKKKPKISKIHNTTHEKTSMSKKLNSVNSCESLNIIEKINKDNKNLAGHNSPEHPLEMKMEPFEMTVEEFQKQLNNDKDQIERLDIRPSDKIPGTSKTNLLNSISPTTSLNSPGYFHSDQLATSHNDVLSLPNNGINNNSSYPPFPCPFCDRAYTSWGFRRRHIKAVHTISPELNCKWCMEILPTHAAWRRHVVSAHNLSASDAHNGLLILEEAHMVLQIAHPTRLDAIVNIIKQNSSQSQ